MHQNKSFLVQLTTVYARKENQIEIVIDSALHRKFKKYTGEIERSLSSLIILARNSERGPGN